MSLLLDHCLTPLLHNVPTLVAQGQLEEALEMKRKGLAIEERVLPPDHPQMARSLNNLAVLLKNQVRTVINFQKIMGSTFADCHF